MNIKVAIANANNIKHMTTVPLIITMMFRRAGGLEPPVSLDTFARLIPKQKKDFHLLT